MAHSILGIVDYGSGSLDSKLKSFIINTLRRASFRWKPRGECKKAAKVKVGEYKTGRDKFGYRCAICKEVYKSGEVQIDHKFAVICPIEGFTGFDSFIERMFCNEENFQSLCDLCHNEKTGIEKDFRKRVRELKKEKKCLSEIRNEYLEWIK